MINSGEVRLVAIAFFITKYLKSFLIVFESVSLVSLKLFLYFGWLIIIKRFIKIKSSRSPEAELHDFYNNYIKKYITLQLDLTEDKNTEVKIL